jgi:hypothetical protein
MTFCALFAGVSSPPLTDAPVTAIQRRLVASAN